MLHVLMLVLGGSINVPLVGSTRYWIDPLLIFIRRVSMTCPPNCEIEAISVSVVAEISGHGDGARAHAGGGKAAAVCSQDLQPLPSLHVPMLAPAHAREQVQSLQLLLLGCGG